MATTRVWRIVTAELKNSIICLSEHKVGDEIFSYSSHKTSISACLPSGPAFRFPLSLFFIGGVLVLCLQSMQAVPAPDR